MANDEHIAILRQGVKVWNRWRAENPDVRPQLNRANLSDASLSGSLLYEASLFRADLSGADLFQANLYDTVLANVDLSETKNLDDCLHGGPSIIDHRTLQRSGQLPLNFLRGVGLPDNLLSLLNQPIRFYSCFISYSCKDDEFAHRLHADLQNEGIRCWFASHDLPIVDAKRKSPRSVD